MSCPPALCHVLLCCAVLCSTIPCPQALAAEVERRQSAVWSPAAGTPDAQLTPVQRQQRLRTARSVLSVRVQEQRRQQQAQAAGGFQFGDDVEAAEDWGYAGMKRQRL